MNRRWTGLGAAVVLAFLCIPLFIGLGKFDLENDEAIYSFAVDRILETGDWLTPKSSPNEDFAFLEKPPLKMWIVAAPIRAGVLPLNEFGLRFWDALFGGAVFLYTFLLAARLSNPLAGVAAALILFVHRPLLMDHGLRSNNMEAALMLCYTAGVYHFLAWSTADQPARRWRHAIAVGLYFVLGFMTKFVAAIFLPALLGAAALLFRRYRTALLRDWRMWAASAGVALVLITPWFVYAHVKYGEFFWHTILAESIYRRFTAFLDPSHLHPWWYYVVAIYQWLQRSGTLVLVAAGLVFLAAKAIAKHSVESAVMLLWFALPITLISFGTSKLYHYAYPFLPPLAIGGGCVLAAGARAAQQWVAKAAAAVRHRHARQRGLRAAFLTIAFIGFIIAFVTVVNGPIRIEAAGKVLFRNGSLIRPLLIAVLFAILGGSPQLVSRVAVPLLVLALLPLPAYRDTIPLLTVPQHPIRSVAECITAVEQRRAAAGYPAPGLYVDAANRDISHPQYYYLRRVRPWMRAAPPDRKVMATYLYRPEFQRPILIADKRYHELVSGGVIGARPALLRFDINGLLMLLPGPYATCSTAMDPSAP